jgi:cobyrinic acid a,c-diamide synthase
MDDHPDTGPAIPRVVIAALESGAGKTTVTVAIAAALRARDLRVAVFKCGPDYLDPMWHRRAAGVTSHNLDGWMMGREAVRATFARAANGCDIAIVEGMMGLFDGAAPDSDEGSTAEIAKWLDAPVLVTVDTSGMVRTIAAIAEGVRHFDPAIRLGGLFANRIGGRGHLDLMRAVPCAVPIVGGFPADPAGAFPERHLGLAGALDDSFDDSIIERWAAMAETWLDLDSIMKIARGAPDPEWLAKVPASEVTDGRRPCRIGVAFDEAIHFYYEDNLSRLRSLGAELEFFSPLRDSRIPAVDGLILGGGYPEVYAERLSSNRSMLESIRNFARSGAPIYAECGGLMYLADAIRTLEGRRWPMAGLIAGDAVMADRLQALGYVDVATDADSIIGPAGTRFRGHQFRYSTLEGVEPGAERIYRVSPRWFGAPFAEGYRSGNLLASYVHAHWASNPAVAAALVESCARRRDIGGGKP